MPRPNKNNRRQFRVAQPPELSRAQALARHILSVLGGIVVAWMFGVVAIMAIVAAIVFLLAVVLYIGWFSHKFKDSRAWKRRLGLSVGLLLAAIVAVVVARWLGVVPVVIAEVGGSISNPFPGTNVHVQNGGPITVHDFEAALYIRQMMNASNVFVLGGTEMAGVSGPIRLEPGDAQDYELLGLIRGDVVFAMADLFITFKPSWGCQILRRIPLEFRRVDNQAKWSRIGQSQTRVTWNCVKSMELSSLDLKSVPSVF